MGSWAMSSDNSNKGPLECEDEKENEFGEDASSASVSEDDDVDPSLEALESSREDADNPPLILLLFSSSLS